MAVTEAQRLSVYQGFKNVLETEVADVIMEMLPREGWDDVVRRRDLDVVDANIRQEIGHLNKRLSGLNASVWAFVAIISASQIAILSLLATGH